MKRFFCLIFSALLVLSLCPGAVAESAAEPLYVDLSLACDPDSGYGWIADSSAVDVAIAQDLDITTEDDPNLVGSPALHRFCVTGVGTGDAYLTFSYQRPGEDTQPVYYFWLEVSVDEQLNVTVKPELVLPGDWDYASENEGILEVTASEPDEDGNRHFLLVPKQDGNVTFLLYDEPAGSAYEYQVTCHGGSAIIHSISLRWEDQSSGVPFAPVVSFTTTDFEGNTVTEQVFAGHSLTILNFWEPWCGPCVGEMPDLQKLSQEYADRGVQVIGVFATPDADEDVQAVLERTGVAYPILRYVQAFGPMQTGYVPTTVILDGTGAVVKGPFARALDYADWCALVEELL